MEAQNHSLGRFPPTELLVNPICQTAFQAIASEPAADNTSISIDDPYPIALHDSMDMNHFECREQQHANAVQAWGFREEERGTS